MDTVPGTQQVLNKGSLLSCLPFPKWAREVASHTGRHIGPTVAKSSSAGGAAFQPDSYSLAGQRVPCWGNRQLKALRSSTRRPVMP